MAKGGWAAFPHKDSAYDYSGPSLKKHWDRLHRGDCERFPKDAAAQEAWLGGVALAIERVHHATISRRARSRVPRMG